MDSLDNRSQQKCFEVIELLEQYGKSLPEPHAKHLQEGVYELRFFGIEGRIRILYFFYHKSKAVFTNGLIKKTGAVSGNVLKTAKKRMNIYFKR
ncbi:MAG: type II toxin-antitoxin system RelE/ParE family toxin [Candidatus Omnitrophica bacterium]|nr:type II toxin-antitoxin system RelE/ParE family toxin [Candidatus Omnitrophota bacterium]